jgi:hypothetical protein
MEKQFLCSYFGLVFRIVFPARPIHEQSGLVNATGWAIDSGKTPRAVNWGNPPPVPEAGGLSTRETGAPR